jgi:MarR family transcriptional regulator, transcriptional regulator for hemolysin
MHPTIFRLKRAYLATRKTIDDGLAGYNITWAQLEVLLELYTVGSLEQRELQETLCLANPTLTRTLDHLVKNGYVLREVTAADARVKRLTLTPTALRLLDTLADKEHVRLVNSFFHGFTEAEMTAFTTFLARVEQNMLDFKQE